MNTSDQATVMFRIPRHLPLSTLVFLALAATLSWQGAPAHALMPVAQDEEAAETRTEPSSAETGAENDEDASTGDDAEEPERAPNPADSDEAPVDSDNESPADSDGEAPAEPESGAPADSDGEAPPAAAIPLNALFAETGSLPIEARFLALSAAAASISPATPDAALDWVRANFRVEPGEGNRRGARGTLFSQAGNPLELSLLLGAILTEQRVQWRLASATLGPRELGALLRVMNPSARLPGAPEETLRYDPDADVRRQSSLRTHYWIEARQGNQWRALDPSIPVLPAGVSLVEAERWLEPEVAAAELGGWVTIQIRAVQDGRQSSPLLSRRLPLADVVYRNLGLGWYVDTATNQLHAHMDLGQEQATVAPVTMRSLSALHLEVSIESGALLRSHEIALSTYESADRPWLDARHTLVIAPGIVSTSYLRGAAVGIAGELRSAHEDIERRASAGEPAPIGGDGALRTLFAQLAGLRALTSLHHADLAADSIGRAMGVRPVLPQPRVVISSVTRSSRTLSTSMTLWHAEPDAFPAEGVPDAMTGAFHVLLSRYVDLLLAPDRAARDTETLELATLYAGNTSALSRFTSASHLQSAATEVVEAGDVALILRAGSAPADAVWAVRRTIGAITEANSAGLRQIPGLQADIRAGFLEGLHRILADALEKTLVEHRRSSPDEALLCRAHCQASRIAPRMCADERDRPPIQFALCLTESGDTGTASLRSLRGAQGCSSAVRPAGCGALIANVLLSGRARIAYENEAVSHGRWSDISPARASCTCPR